jgi:phosphate/sulfate permease
MQGAWFLVPIVAILAGCAMAIAKTMAMARVRELEIRERIAMIERGLVPPPEVDPGGFDRAMARFERVRPSFRSGQTKHRRAGITFMGVGVGLTILIAFAAGEPQVGVGVGGFLLVIGIAFFINSLFEEQSSSRDPLPASASRPSGPVPPSSTEPR